MLLILLALLSFGQSSAYNKLQIHNYGLATRLRGTKIRYNSSIYEEYSDRYFVPTRTSQNNGSASNYHKCEEARRALYNSIIDSNGSIDVMTPKSDKASSRMSQAVKLLVDYIIVQHQSYNGRLQFESTVKTLKHFYLYVSSVSSSPLEVFDQVYTLLGPLVPHKVLLQLKCIQFTTHVRQKNLTYAQVVLLNILSLSREQKSKQNYSKYVKHRFPLDLNTVSDLMQLLLVYPSKNKQSMEARNKGCINIGAPSSSSDFSFSPRSQRNASLLTCQGGPAAGGYALFPLSPQVATLDARRVQQRQSLVVFELYMRLVEEDKSSGGPSILSRAKIRVVDQIHEHGTRAAIVLNRFNDAVIALGKISKQYLATDRMQTLTLHLLRMLRGNVDDHDLLGRGRWTMQVGRIVPTHSIHSRLAKSLCLMIPLNLISYRPS